MPSRLKRIYGRHDLHFVTCSCYRREPLLGSGRSRDVFLRIFEQVRRKYRFEVVGYVVMPEHFHVLIGEPEIGTPSTVMQVLKQRVGQRLLPPRRKNQNQLGLWRENGKQKKRHFFQPRFYDFNVYTRKKMIEKLRYMHRNPVKLGHKVNHLFGFTMRSLGFGFSPSRTARESGAPDFSRLIWCIRMGTAGNSQRRKNRPEAANPNGNGWGHSAGCRHRACVRHEPSRTADAQG